VNLSIIYHIWASVSHNMC